MRDVSLSGHCGTVAPAPGCQGESVLFMTYTPPPDTNPHPQKYALLSAETVGSYAMRFTWGDGHDQGLYTWEHLRSLCECSVCLEARTKEPLRG